MKYNFNFKELEKMNNIEYTYKLDIDYYYNCLCECRDCMIDYYYGYINGILEGLRISNKIDYDTRCELIKYIDIEYEARYKK